MGIPVALQLYSVRDDAARDLFGVLEQVKEMGYDGVEFAGYYGNEATAIAEALQRIGLKVAGAHVPLGSFDDDKFEETLKFHETIACKNLVVPWIPEHMHNSVESAKEASELFTRLADKLRPRGFRTGFHVHGGDVKPLEGGTNAWYVIAENTPEDFILQWDTHNGVSGGADAVQPIRDFPGRGITTHLKKWSGPDGGEPIGQGEIPWSDVFEACESGAGTEWYVVEHESYSGMSPLDAVRACREGLRKLGK